MDVNPYFSIIVPTYNRGYIINKMIDSLIQQEFEDWELIIVDDGSDDSTNEVIEFYKKDFSAKIYYFKFDKNKGVNIARNFGATKAKGNWLVFQDSDDEFTKHALTILYDLTKRVEVPLIWSACITQSGKKMTNQPEFEGYVSFKDLWCEKLKGEYLPTIKREVFLRFMFPEDIKGGEGILWHRIAKDYGRIFVSNKITRIYNDRLEDRLSVKKRNFDRLCKVFKKDLEIFWKDYLKYCPLRFAEKLLKFSVYKTLSLMKG